MNPITIKQLIKVVHGKADTVDNTLNISGVCIDSRTIEPGQVFFAIRGENFDGHDYVASAIQKGDCCAVVERDVNLPASCNASIIKVDDTITALGKYAAWYRRQLSAKVIAITGSVGKTTTRHILHQILSRHFKCRQAQNSFNNHIGVPLTILSAESDDEILLVELGSNSPGEIEKLSKITHPDIAVITLVAPAHLEGFGSIENILAEKSAIAKGLAPDGVLYINGDQPDLVNYVKANYTVKTKTFGTNGQSDVVGKDLKTEGGYGSLVIDGQVIDVPLASMANLQNCLAAWAVCCEVGIELTDFINAAGLLEPFSMRLTPELVGQMTILNDCYNANPASMVNALSCLRSLKASNNGRQVFIAGCMAEMGQFSESLHTQLGKDAVFSGIDVLLAAGPFASQILEGAESVTKHPVGMQAYENTEQLCDNLHKWIQPDDIILVKGSRSARLERAVERLRELFEE